MGNFDSIVELISDCLEKIKSQADYIEVRAERSVATRIEMRNKELSDCSECNQSGWSVRVFKDDGRSFAAFDSFDDFDSKMKSAIDMARYGQQPGGKAPIVHLTAVEVFESGKAETVTLRDKVNVVQRYNEIMLFSPSIVSTQIEYRDFAKEKLFASSMGSRIKTYSDAIIAMLIPIAKHKANIERDIEIYCSDINFSGFNNLDQRVERSARLAKDLTHAKRIEPFVGDVLLDQAATGTLFHEVFGHLSEADLIIEHPLLEEKLRHGSKLGSDNLTIIDNGTIEGWAGSFRYDDEGVQAKETFLMQDGVVRGHMHSLDTAIQIREEPTGNARTTSYRFPPIVRMSNTYVDNGGNSFQEMLSDIETGVYVRGSCPARNTLGKYVLYPREVYRVERGEVKELLSGAVIYGDIFETLKNVSGVGDDLQFCNTACTKGSQLWLPVGTGGPHVLINGLQIGGYR